MTSSQPLNQAILNQLLQDIRNGCMRRVQSMGWNEQMLQELQSKPELMAMLFNTSVTWANVQINEQVVQRLFKQVQSTEEEQRVIDRALRLGANYELMNELFGLSGAEISQRRRLLGIQARKGRKRALTHDEESAIWKRWAKVSEECNVNLDDPMSVLDAAMLITEEQCCGRPVDQNDICLHVIWNAVQSWIEDGLLHKR